MCVERELPLTQSFDLPWAYTHRLMRPALPALRQSVIQQTFIMSSTQFQLLLKKYFYIYIEEPTDIR